MQNQYGKVKKAIDIIVGETDLSPELARKI